MLKNMLDPEGSSCDKPDYSYVSSQVDVKRSSENDQAFVDDIKYKKMLRKMSKFLLKKESADIHHD